VQPGDTLNGIAAKTGVAVEDLQRLNPDIDTQALVPGSTLKLR
jgi:LysM repeat protein